MTDVIQLAAVTHEFASDRVLAFASEGRLVQGSWHRGGGRGGDGGVGREFACLLGSIHGDIDSVGKCPAHLMPPWMGHLTVRLFDGLPADKINHYGRLYGESMRRWSALDADAWERVRLTFIAKVFQPLLDKAAALQAAAQPYAWWSEVEAILARLKAYLSDKASLDLAGRRALRDDAWSLRQKLWDIYYAKRAEARKLRAKATASGGGDADAAEAVEAAVEVVAVAAAEAAVVAVAVAAAAAVAVEAVARRTSYAQSFDVILAAIDEQLAA